MFLPTATAAAHIGIITIRVVNLIFSGFSPSPIATSSPRFNIFILGDNKIAIISPIIPTKNTSLKSAQLAFLNPPDTQNPIICDWFDKSPIIVVKEIKNVLIAVPAKRIFAIELLFAFLDINPKTIIPVINAPINEAIITFFVFIAIPVA